MEEVGGGVSKNQSCSEYPETHFGFGIFEKGKNVLSGHKQASNPDNTRTKRHYNDQISHST